eukprot:1805979-Amphidinium_carterae.1
MSAFQLHRLLGMGVHFLEFFRCANRALPRASCYLNEMVLVGFPCNGFIWVAMGAASQLAYLHRSGAAA